MARKTIYVDDELDAAMKELDKQVNWSEVAQAAWRATIATKRLDKRIDRAAAIERLKASRRQTREGERAAGFGRGTLDAARTLSYEQLLKVVNFGEEMMADVEERQAGQAIAQLLGEDYHVLWARTDDEPELDVSAEYVRGWIDGVAAFYEDIREELEGYSREIKPSKSKGDT